MDIIEKALEVASQAHEKQYRKRTKIPYITHPAAVGMILLKEGYDEEIVAAGILHDTVEDTDLSLDDIENMFGHRIAEIVYGCSEPDKSLPWEDRKNHTIEYLKTAPKEVRVVACADKLHNVRSILKDYQQDGEAVWDRFNRGKEQQEWYYRNVAESLGSLGPFELQQQLTREVELLFKKKEN
jgi:(p)ppGpp synthase/HD superfamily hydrolase